MEKFKALTYSLRIEEIEVEKETNSFVWVKTSNGRLRQDAKATSSSKIFDTKEEAIWFVIEHKQKKVDDCLNQLRVAEEDLEKTKKHFGYE